MGRPDAGQDVTVPGAITAHMSNPEVPVTAMGSERERNEPSPSQFLARIQVRSKEKLKELEHPRRVETQIARPRGTAGHDYNLQNAMELADNDLRLFPHQSDVRAIVQASGLDKNVRWNRQPLETVSKIFKVVSRKYLFRTEADYFSDSLQARKKQPYLKRFAHDWATEEFAKAYLKRHRGYCKRTRKAAVEEVMRAEGTSASLSPEAAMGNSSEEDEDMP